MAGPAQRAPSSAAARRLLRLLRLRLRLREGGPAATLRAAAAAASPAAAGSAADSGLGQRVRPPERRVPPLSEETRAGGEDTIRAGWRASGTSRRRAGGWGRAPWEGGLGVRGPGEAAEPPCAGEGRPGGGGEGARSGPTRPGLAWPGGRLDRLIPGSLYPRGPPTSPRPKGGINPI